MLRVQQHQMEWKAASPWARLRNASGSENDVRQDDGRRKLSEQTSTNGCDQRRPPQTFQSPKQSTQTHTHPPNIDLDVIEVSGGYRFLITMPDSRREAWSRITSCVCAIRLHHSACASFF